MRNSIEIRRGTSKDKRAAYAIAFAFGLGAALGSALAMWITNMLAH